MGIKPKSIIEAEKNMEAKKSEIRIVDVKKYGFVIEPRYFFYGWSKSAEIKGRESAVKALVRARKLLPKGYNFKIWDCQRSRKVNLIMIDSFKKRLKIIYPRWSSKERTKLLVKFCGSVPPPIRITELGTHRNSGSFDLTIINKKGDELYMGTDFDDLTKKAATNYYENKSKPGLLEKEAKKNRRLLKRVMKKAGFVNYPFEWWHWSYDR
jgi:zinc D-Ala-D-Ala dipeptidase